MKEIYLGLKEAVRQGKTCALATIVKQAGPAPRGVGTQCLIMADGSIVGTVGGGLLEVRTIREAAKVFETGLPRRLSLVLKGKDVEQSDMLCGGQAEVFIEPVSGPSHVPIFQEVAAIEKRGGKAVVATVLDPTMWEGDRVPKLLVRDDGQTIGQVSDMEWLEEIVSHEMAAILDTRSPRLIPVERGEGYSLDIFLEPVAANPVLYVFGGGHVSRQIVPLAARVGFRVVVVDDREEFTRKEQFPDADEVHLMRFKGAVEGLPIDKDAFLVIVTRGHMHDKDVLAQALKTSARYVGMIGSKRKRDMIYDKLLEEGFTPDDLKRVHSPIGLEIGAETPEEIAVSIVAELIKVRAGM